MVDQVTGSLYEMSQTVVEQLDQPALLVGPLAETIAAVIETATGLEEPSTIRILANEASFKQIRQNFRVASKTADLVEAGHLECRTLPNDLNNQLLITEASITAIVTVGEDATALLAEEQDFVDAANEEYEELWTNAGVFPLRTPPLSRVRETLRDTFGDEFADDFETLFDSIEPLGVETNFDEVALFLLLAAKHEELLYDISRWAEDIGLASKASFSRTKTRLEEKG